MGYLYHLLQAQGHHRRNEEDVKARRRGGVLGKLSSSVDMAIALRNSQLGLPAQDWAPSAYYVVGEDP